MHLDHILLRARGDEFDREGSWPSHNRSRFGFCKHKKNSRDGYSAPHDRNVLTSSIVSSTSFQTLGFFFFFFFFFRSCPSPLQREPSVPSGGTNITGSAVIQHLAKLRIRMFPSLLHYVHQWRKKILTCCNLGRSAPPPHSFITPENRRHYLLHLQSQQLRQDHHSPILAHHSSSLFAVIARRIPLFALQDRSQDQLPRSCAQFSSAHR